MRATDNRYEVEVMASDGTDNSAPADAHGERDRRQRATDILKRYPSPHARSPRTPLKVHKWAVSPLTTLKTMRWCTSSPARVTRTSRWTPTDRLSWLSNAVLDFETLPTYTLDLDMSPTQKDADGNSDSEVDHTITITINLTDVQPPPQMELPAFSAASTADTTSMLILKWVAPTLLEGTPSITGYEVQYREQEESNWIVHNFESDGSTSETTITGLASNTYYDAQVRAVNIEGPGDWSPTSSAKTTEAELIVAFSSETYTVNEGDTATTTGRRSPQLPTAM